MFAFVRCKRLVDAAAIAAASSHALGSDRSARSRRREGYDGPRAVCFIKNDSNTWDKPEFVYPPKSGATDLPRHVDYTAAYQRHLTATGARKAPNAHAAMHLIVGVSPEYFGKPDGTHEGHDHKSKKVRRLLVAAANWAEAELGGVWAARYDLDERGFGIVDVMCSPVRPHGKNGKPYVSIRKAQAEVQEKYPSAARGYGAMQSSWADYATEALGTPFDRGVPKAVTGREHLIAEQYGEAMDAGRKRVTALEKEIAGMERILKRVRSERDALKKRLDHVRRAMRRIGGRLTSWALSRYRAASRPTLPPDPEDEELAEEAVGLAVTLSVAADTADEPADNIRARIKGRMRKKRLADGWGYGHPEAPLHSAWEAEITGLADADADADADAPAYEDWRHDLAHASARGVTADRRDLIRLARRTERAAGTYVTRAERRRRQQAGEPVSGEGGIER